MQATCECLSWRGTLDNLQRRNAEDALGETTYRDFPVHARSVVVTAHELMERGAFTADFFLPAVGALSDPLIPQLPGIEITAIDDGRDVHMLGYFFDLESVSLQVFLAEQRRQRHQVGEAGAHIIGVEDGVFGHLANARV